MKSITEKYKKWKEGKDNDYQVDEIYDFLAGLSRYQIHAVFEFLEEDVDRIESNED